MLDIHYRGRVLGDICLFFFNSINRLLHTSLLVFLSVVCLFCEVTELTAIGKLPFVCHNRQLEIGSGCDNRKFEIGGSIIDDCQIHKVPICAYLYG